MRTKDDLLVAMFNQLYEVGDEIQMLDDFGIQFTAITTQKATILGGHTPVVSIKIKETRAIEIVYALERLIIN